MQQQNNSLKNGKQRGRFITVEGVEGGGKSSNIQYIADFLAQHKIDCVITREPGGTTVAEAIRAVVLDKRLPNMHPDTELLLMFAARAEHLQKKILPALHAGQWVISDRFTDATYAYQGGGRGINTTRIAALERWTQGEVQPDLTLLLDLDVEVGLQRTRQRGEVDRFEEETVAFFQRIRQHYLQRAKCYPERYRVINAAQPLMQVQQQLNQTLAQYFACTQMQTG
ncbi:MAG TPA: dTMP kinase [Thiothrix sp.]|nr:dTMP kinase [Thiothrix sp.]